MHDIHLVHSLDTVQWADYILGYLTKECYNLKILRHEDTNLLSDQSSSLLSYTTTTTPNKPASSCPAKTLIVIVSPVHLRFLHENLHFRYDGLIADPRKGQLFLCGAEAADFDELDANGFPVSHRFPSFEEWTRLDHNEHAVLLTNAIIFVESSTCPDRTQINRPTSVTRGRRKVKFTMKPQQVRSHDSTVVTVFFEKELPDRAACSDPDPVVVVLEGYLSGGQRKSFSITADRYNPYTCQFTAPPNLVGEVRAKVVLGGLELGTHLLNYAPAPTADALKDLLDIHVQLIAESLECFAKSGHSLEDLDQRLANIVQESHGAAEQLFTPIQYTTHSDPTQLKNPTLLHVAARHGLGSFISQLTDLPDVKLAIRMVNANDQTPEQLARASDHEALAQTLHDLNLEDSDEEDDYVPLRPNATIKLESDVEGSSPAYSDDDDGGYMEMNEVMLTIMNARVLPDNSTEGAVLGSKDEQPIDMVEKVQKSGHSKGALQADEPEGSARPISGQQEMDRPTVATGRSNSLSYTPDDSESDSDSASDDYEHIPKSLPDQSQQRTSEPLETEPPEPSEPHDPAPFQTEPPKLPEPRKQRKTESHELFVPLASNEPHEPHKSQKSPEPLEPDKPPATYPTPPLLSRRNEAHQQQHQQQTQSQQHREPFELSCQLHHRQQQLSHSVSETNLSSSTHMDRITGSGAVGESPVNSVPESQKELIDILNQIVSGQMTLAEGECLAEEWKMRHPKPNEQKQAKLSRMRVEVDKSQSSKGHRTFWQRLGRRPSDVGDKTASSSASLSPENVSINRSTSFSTTSKSSTMKPTFNRVAVVSDRNKRYSKSPIMDQTPASRHHQPDSTSASTTLTMTVRMGEEFLPYGVVEASTENRCSAASEASSRESYRSVTSRTSTSSGVDIDNVDDEQSRDMERVRFRHPCLNALASEHTTKLAKRKSRNLEMLEEELSNTDAPSPPPVPKASSKTTKKNHGTVMRLHRLYNSENSTTSDAKVKAENQSEDGRRRSHSDGNIGKPFLTLIPEKKGFWRSLITSGKHSTPEQSSSDPLPAPSRNQQQSGGTSLFAKMRKHRSRSPMLTTVKASLTLNKSSSERCNEAGSYSQSCSHLNQVQAAPTVASNLVRPIAHENEINSDVPDEVSPERPWKVYEHYQAQPKVPEKTDLACAENTTSDFLKNERSNVGFSQPKEVLLRKGSSSGDDPTPESTLTESKVRKHSPEPGIKLTKVNSSPKIMALFGEELNIDSGSTTAISGTSPQLPPIGERPFRKVSERRPLPTPSDSPDTPGGTHLTVQAIKPDMGSQSSCKLNEQESCTEKVRVVHPPFPSLPVVTMASPLPFDATELTPLTKVLQIEKVDSSFREDETLIQKIDTLCDNINTFSTTQEEEGERVLKANNETQHENSCNTARSANEETTSNDDDEIQKWEDENQNERDNSEYCKADGRASIHGYYTSISIYINSANELVQDVEMPKTETESKAPKERENEEDTEFQSLDGSGPKSISSTHIKLIQGVSDDFGNQYCSENFSFHADHHSLDIDSVKHTILGKLETDNHSQSDFGCTSNDSQPERIEEQESLVKSYSQSAYAVERSAEENGFNTNNNVSSSIEPGKCEAENLESAIHITTMRPLKWILHFPEETILSSQSASCREERPSASLPGTLRRRRVPSPSKPLPSTQLSTGFILHASEEFQIPLVERERRLNTQICGAESEIGKSILRRSRSMDGAQFDSDPFPTKKSIAKSKSGQISDSSAHVPDHKTSPISRNSSFGSQPSSVSLPVLPSSEVMSLASPKQDAPFQPTAPTESINKESYRTVHDKLRQRELANSRGPAHTSMPNVTPVQLRHGKAPRQINTTTVNQEISESELNSAQLSIIRRSMPCIESLPTKLKLFVERQILSPNKRHTISSSAGTCLFDSNLSFATDRVSTRPATPAKAEQDNHSSAVSRGKRHSVYGYPSHFSSHVLEAGNTPATYLERREKEDTSGISSKHRRCSSSSLPGKFASPPLLGSKRDETNFGAAEQENKGSPSSAWDQSNHCPRIKFSSTPSLISEANKTTEINVSAKEISAPKTKRHLIAYENVCFNSAPSLASETETIPAPFPRVLELKVESWTPLTSQMKAGASCARSKYAPPVLPKPKQRPRSLSDPTAKQSRQTKASEKAGIQNHRIVVDILTEKNYTIAIANDEAKSDPANYMVNTDRPKAFDSVAPRQLTPAKHDVSDIDEAFSRPSVFAGDVVNQTISSDSVFEDEKAIHIEALNKPHTSPRSCRRRPLFLDNSSCAKPVLKSFDQPRPHSLCSPISEECSAITPIYCAVFKDVGDNSTADYCAAHPRRGPSVHPKRRRSDSLDGKR